MAIKFNVPGKKRKELAEAIATWLGTAATYAGAPSFAYHISDQVLERDGSLIFTGLGEDTIERLLQHLYDEGFEFEASAPQTVEPAPAEPDCLSIQLPRADFTEGTLVNLHSLIEVKGALIKKALGVDALPITEGEEWIAFPWFPADIAAEDAQAYIHFISALGEMARNQKRINSKEKTVDNEKYAFRCFLLRLGFIGAEFKQEREVLLRNLTGSSAFKSGTRNEVEE